MSRGTASNVVSKPEIILAEREWPVRVWVEVGMPNLRTAGCFRKDFKANNRQIGEYADSLLGHADFTVARVPMKLPLTVIMAAELGFTKWTRYDTICARADKLGLDQCPNEIGPQLCRQCPDQPLGEWIVVAMKAIPGPGRDLHVFIVAQHKDGLWLNTDYGSPDCEFSPGDRFAFVPRWPLVA